MPVVGYSGRVAGGGSSAGWPRSGSRPPWTWCCIRNPYSASDNAPTQRRCAPPPTESSPLPSLPRLRACKRLGPSIELASFAAHDPASDCCPSCLQTGPPSEDTSTRPSVLTRATPGCRRPSWPPSPPPPTGTQGSDHAMTLATLELLAAVVA